MKKVIDAGAMRSPELERFLSSSTNYAIVTDYASMESLKGNASKNIERSLRTLSKYPKQVVVLKSTYEITKLRPRKTGIHSRFTDTKQTKGFSEFSAAIKRQEGNGTLVDFDLAFKSLRSNQHFDRLAQSAETIRRGISITASSYSENDMYLLRSKKPLSPDFIDRIRRDILHVTALHFRDASAFSELPTVGDAFYSFPFRYALCSHALTIRWISEGGYENVSIKKIKNDFTDMTYAAYATFYDGLLTKDRELRQVYQTSKWLLQRVFYEMAEQ